MQDVKVGRARGLVAGLGLLAGLASCSREPRRAPAQTSSSGQPAYRVTPSTPPPGAASATPSREPPTPAGSSSSSPAPIVVVHSYDAGLNACRLTYGPVRQAFVGDATLVTSNLPEGTVRVVWNHDGAPVSSLVSAPDAATPPSDAAGAEVDAGVPAATSPPCAVAGAFAFCMDRTGGIHRRPLESEGRDAVVARARPGTSFAAESLGGTHVAIAYLADRKTTEGMVSEAYAVLDEGPPVRLSEDGSGATHVALASRGASLLALLVDGRTAMTPVHARMVSLGGAKLLLGEDAVVFVGGGAEANTRGALGVSAAGAAFALVPIAGEAGFGLAGVTLHDPPHLDEPTTFSPYLNGLDPAPVAATRGTTPIRVARVRPLEARADAPRGLELGRLDDAGAFVSYGLVASKGRVRSASIASAGGSLWVAFTDGTGTWLERRACP